ncbi:phospholipase D/transphosphatidylase [Salinisphaera sp. PC39]|uniref:cardiolipin synthase n=1 Tax=Salinisphaera sp. PC39 TaxID=1304156 RepID=UPI00333EE102
MTLDWLALLQFWGPVVLAALTGIAAALHALLNKRNPSAALGWVAVCLLFPPVGPVLYALFGINRVRMRARRLEARAAHSLGPREAGVQSEPALVDPALPALFTGLANAGDRLAGCPLVGGNEVTPLINGEGAFPPMLEAIEKARRYIYLTTYIFETNRIGRRFIDTLAAAVERGVDVRVLIDGVGDYYALPRRRASVLLRKRGVRVARFLPPRLLPPSLGINLRNHRKILVADGEVAFTGGMNIGDRHFADNRRRRRVEDLHFAFRGPVVNQIEAIFLGDWAFVTGQQTEPTPPTRTDRGDALCRAVDDGPTEDTDRLAALLSAAVASARQRVLIMTPYFLPSPELVGALQSAALRGLDVSIVLPAHNNLPYVHWASRHGLRDLLVRGVKVYYRPPPFAHTKLFVIDDAYAVLGSANIDPRSLRLNFELAVEVYDTALVPRLAEHIVDTLARSSRYTLADDRGRSLPVRLRDSMAWLLSPYL